MAKRRFRFLLAMTIFVVSVPLLHAQSDEVTAALTPAQREARTKAEHDFAIADWATAFDEFKALHGELPDNATIAEYLGESALNLNRYPFAIELLEPIAKSSPSHWQAVALLARAYAETNRDADRDAEIVILQGLHDSGRHARLSKMQQFLLERHVLAKGGDVSVWYSLEPWGRFKTYVYARYTDAAGKEQAYMTLESSDFDQPLWAKEHPQEAAAGQRVFSLDSYTVPVQNGNGTATSTHGLVGFFNGRPSYDLIRDRMVASLSRRAETSKAVVMPPSVAVPATVP